MANTQTFRLLGCSWFCWLALPLWAAPVVFQIGSPDSNYAEFAIAADWAAFARQFPDDATFVVGQSDPKRDWPYILPGPADAWAGSKSHTFKIKFQAPQALSGYYELILDFVSTQGAVPPRLAIDINGQRIERALPRGSGDDALTNARAGKKCSVHQLIPAALLHSGENVIALTDLEGSWALFDDLRLESGVSAPKQTLDLKTEPLPFFKRSPEGLQRAVKVSINNLESGARPADLLWNSGTGSGSQEFELRFGQTDVLLLVPDVRQVQLTLRCQPAELKVTLNLPAARKWRLFIVPTSHTDVGYTDLQARVRERHAENGLRALELCDQYPFFKWYSETYWQLDALLELHPEKAGAALERLRQKRFGLSGDYANLLTGLCSSEALNRLTLDSCDLAHRARFTVNSVILDDVPSAIGSLPMALANSGIKYFIEGANNDRAPYAGAVPNPFYWEGADGSRVLADITTHPGYAGAGDLIRDMKRAAEQLPRYLVRFDTTNYPYDAVLVNGAFSDNREIEPWLPKVVEDWNAQWEFPKLVLALPQDFFGYIETNYSGRIPVLKTDFGGWWEDGAGSSALETALSRRAEERTVTAEMLHSLGKLLSGAAYPKATFDAVWHDILLYNEHTWGAAGSISHPESEQTVKQWEVKGGFAHQADAQSRELLASGMAKLAAMVPTADLVVFNSLAWPRRTVVKSEVTAAAIQDLETKRTLPCQSLPEGGSCFIADDLPSVGYRCYGSPQAAARVAFPQAVKISSHQIENEFYRVTLDPQTGGIQSLYDKELRRELVDTNGEFTLGELIYVTGGEGTSAIHSDLNSLPPPHFQYHRQKGIRIEHTSGPVFGELTSRATAENFPRITLRVRLYRGLKQLDLIAELDKQETTNKEAVYLAFPFAVDARKGGLWLEYPDEITEPLKDQHPSACRDWYSVQRWLAVSDGSATVELSPLDTPLFTIGKMTASTWPRELALQRGHVFAYLMNNYWHTNYKAEQGGHFAFRFSLTSNAGGFSRRDAVVKGWDMFCPAVASGGERVDRNAVPRGSHSILSFAAKSLVAIEPAGLPLLTIKQAEDENGFVFRCCDYAGLGGTAKLRLPTAVDKMFACNLVETDARDLNEHGKTVRASIKPYGLLTLEGLFPRVQSSSDSGSGRPPNGIKTKAD